MSAFGPEVKAEGALALPCWVGGHAYLALAETYYTVQAADGGALRRVPLCGEEPVRAAVAAAAEAQAAWSALDPAARTACVADLQALLQRYRAHVAGLIAEECATPELGERELADALNALAALDGLSMPPTPADRLVAVIADAETPLAAPAACTLAALAAGCAVILRPSPRAPSALLALAEIFSRAGFPPGLVNLVHGDEAVIRALCAAPEITAVACTGPALAGKIAGIAAERCLRFVGDGPEGRLLDDWRRCLGAAS